jgi:hypothetical protein
MNATIKPVTPGARGCENVSRPAANGSICARQPPPYPQESGLYGTAGIT